MKELIAIIILSITSFVSFAQASISETTKTETFIKIWGFLKYHHPVVAKGKIDWDNEFTKRIKDFNALNSKQEINQYYITWIRSLGKPDVCKDCQFEPKSGLKANSNFEWLKDSSVFDRELIDELVNIRNNRNQKSNYYVSQVKGVGNTNFENEKKYPDSIYPSAEMRLLTLSRYWNIISYFFPYKYKTNQPWSAVLVEMIPKFKYAADTTSYHLAILELTARIDDSHGKFATQYTNKYFGFKWVPFNFKIIDDKAVVTGFHNEELSKKDDVRIGDVFVKIGGLSVEDILKQNSKFIGASNQAIKLRDAAYNILFNGQSNKVETEFERAGKVEQKIISRYGYNEINYKWNISNRADTSKILEGDIGYVNMGNLQLKQVDLVLNGLKNTKAIIFDLRNYPNFILYEIANFHNKEKKPFVKRIIPEVNNPGNFTYADVLFCGSNNSEYYQGKVIVLCNEQTQSRAEFTLMALKTAPNIIVVGSQTSGADGDASEIILPGNLRTMITGTGVYYPDGTETQRIGIIPDVVVQQTIEGIRAGKDEVLDKALAILNRK
ncbi:S41 family peptidase [Pedobacter jamesrossensis]|uniref:S41 family peptidase n=1 Tax=Pedobacter jamesrossensis TaxID=1908238 RepID=A0ABV8NK84_9SPHI